MNLYPQDLLIFQPVDVNYAAVNIGVHVCFQISVLFFSDTYPGMELWDRMVVLFLVFF